MNKIEQFFNKFEIIFDGQVQSVLLTVVATINLTSGIFWSMFAGLIMLGLALGKGYKKDHEKWKQTHPETIEKITT